MAATVSTVEGIPSKCDRRRINSSQKKAEVRYEDPNNHNENL